MGDRAGLPGRRPGAAALEAARRRLAAGKYRRDERPSGATRLGENPERGMEAYDRRGTQRTWDVVDAVREVAEDRGVSMAQVALAWVADRPAVTSVILGARTPSSCGQPPAAGCAVRGGDGGARRGQRPGAADYPYGGRRRPAGRTLGLEVVLNRPRPALFIQRGAPGEAGTVRVAGRAAGGGRAGPGPDGRGRARRPAHRTASPVGLALVEARGLAAGSRGVARPETCSTSPPASRRKRTGVHAVWYGQRPANRPSGSGASSTSARPAVRQRLVPHRSGEHLDHPAEQHVPGVAVGHRLAQRV